MDNVRLTVTSTGEGITKPATGVHYFKKDARIYISALAASGWNFEGWAGNLSGCDSSCVLTINTDKNITARFRQVVHKVSIGVNGRGIIKKSSDAEIYEHGSCLRITAIADAGWKFTGWSGDLSGDHPSQTIVINSNKRISASFLPVQTLIISKIGRGNTTPRPGTYRYEQGSRIYVSALPESGWKLNQWTGDISGRDSTRILTLNSNMNIAAEFQPHRPSTPPATLPITYIANRHSGEIHRSDCQWVKKMKETNKIMLHDFAGVVFMIRNMGYNGCYYCLSRYDRDTLTIESVIRNLEADSIGY